MKLDINDFTLLVSQQVLSPSLLSLSAKLIMTMYNILHSSVPFSTVWILSICYILATVIVVFCHAPDPFFHKLFQSCRWHTYSCILTRKRDLRGLKEPTLSGQGIDLEGTAENVMNKAYRAFQTCKGKPGVWNWGRCIGSNHRPVLTYGSTVWWSWVRYSVSRTELSKFQSLA